MMLGASGSEHKRFRLGLAFLVLGLVLLLFAWFSWLYRTSSPVQVAPVKTETQTSALTPLEHPDATVAGRSRAFVRAAPMVLLATFLLVLVFLIASLVLVRGARRRLAAANRRRGLPTDSQDVWSMHRAPDDPDEHGA